MFITDKLVRGQNYFTAHTSKASKLARSNVFPTYINLIINLATSFDRKGFNELSGHVKTLLFSDAVTKIVEWVSSCVVPLASLHANSLVFLAQLQAAVKKPVPDPQVRSMI